MVSLLDDTRHLLLAILWTLTSDEAPPKRTAAASRTQAKACCTAILSNTCERAAHPLLVPDRLRSREHSRAHNKVPRLATPSNRVGRKDVQVDNYSLPRCLFTNLVRTEAVETSKLDRSCGYPRNLIKACR
uniref:Uncharacterized protein n=1 Tax=Lygus hesperus TaxID=30085 RepID=A0A146M190_LYGHE